MTRSSRRGVPAVALAGLLVLGCGASEPVDPPPMPNVGAAVPIPDEPARQFDFWLGEWQVQNKHLRRGGWTDSGTAVARIQAVADGNAVLERWTGELGGDPLIGFSLRAFDPELGKWVIYLNWHGGQPVGFFVMHGERNGERIELFPPGDKTSERYTFSLAHEGSSQWDNARTKDGGETWVTDWVMQFTRTAPAASTDAASARIELPPEAAAEFEETRALDELIGAWTGSARFLQDDGSWAEGTLDTRVTSMIEGFGLLQFLDTSAGEQTLTALGYDTQVSEWVAVRATNRELGLTRLAGTPGEGSVSFTTDDGSVVETWTRESDDRYRWTRSISGQPTINADLTRTGSSG